jgi:hypothetical protein
MGHTDRECGLRRSIEGASGKLEFNGRDGHFTDYWFPNPL